MATASQQNESLMDAVKRDHAEISSYYHEYRKSGTNLDAKERWANQLIWEIARHAAGEEIVVYPLFEKHLGQQGREMAERDRRDHQAVKDRLYRLEKMSVGSGDYDQLMDETMSVLDEHVKTEESHDLPLLEQQLGTEKSKSEAVSFRRTKQFVPTRPHPSAPSKPPFETVVGLLTAPLDKLKDAFSKFPTEEMLEQAKKEQSLPSK